MRFTAEMITDGNIVPLDYRPAIISFLKHCLTKYEGAKFFELYYSKDGKKAGSYTFALEMPKCKMQNGCILLNDGSIKLKFSTADDKTGVVFFNAMISQIGKQYPIGKDSKFKITNMFLERESKIKDSAVAVRFLSPLCVRKHDKDNGKDWYYSFEQPDFLAVLRDGMRTQLTKKDLPVGLLDGFIIEPVQAKKTVVKHHGVYVECSLGVFKIAGRVELLDYIQKNGLGSRTSAGFGFVQIIG